MALHNILQGGSFREKIGTQVLLATENSPWCNILQNNLWIKADQIVIALGGLESKVQKDPARIEERRDLRWR
jgi:hypothetical protein